MTNTETTTRVRLNDVEVRNQTCQVYVETSHGQFIGITPRGTETSGCRDYNSVLSELGTILTRERVRVRIPFVGGNLRRGTATGIHAGTSNVLYDDEDGSRGLQLDTGYRASVFIDMSDEELAEGRRLHQAYFDAQKAMNEWDVAHRWERFPAHVADVVAEAGKEPAS